MHSNRKISLYTCEVINSFVKAGGIFSFATARSLTTAKPIIKGIDINAPMIINNGIFIVDSQSGERYYSNCFSEYETEYIYNVLLSNNIYPIVYSYKGEVEKFSYLPSKVNNCMRSFIERRLNDKRINPVNKNIDLINNGSVFYFTCIDKEENLCKAYNILKDRYKCIYQKDIYSGEQWLEILPKGVSKASAIEKLKNILSCDRVVCFGDGVNDIEMFKVSDESYAVANADPLLKKYATGIIKENNEDGVAKWLLENKNLIFDN